MSEFFRPWFSLGDHYAMLIGNIKEAEEHLRAEQKHDIADEVQKFQLQLETMYRRLNTQQERLFALFNAIEKWRSNDMGAEQLNQKWQKWLEKNG